MTIKYIFLYNQLIMNSKEKEKTKDDDSEYISNDNTPDDISSIIMGLGINTFKTSIFLFILFILISSDVFIDRILSSSDNKYAEGRHCTTKGTVIQGLLLSIGYIFINTLITCNYI
jgi:hypothetical protein